MKFREWLSEIKHPAVVNQDVKHWLDSADKLKQTVAKLKAILKDKEKEPEKKPIKVEPEKKEPEKKPFEKPEKPEKPEKKPFEKPEKPEKPEKKPIKVEPEKKEPPEWFARREKRDEKPEIKPKIVQKPTKVEKEPNGKKGLNRDDRQS